MAFVAMDSHLGGVAHGQEPSQGGIWWGQWRGWGEMWALAHEEDSTCILSRMDVSLGFLRNAL